MRAAVEAARVVSGLHRAVELPLELDPAASEAGVRSRRGVRELAFDAGQLELNRLLAQVALADVLGVGRQGQLGDQRSQLLVIARDALRRRAKVTYQVAVRAAQQPRREVALRFDRA